MAENLFLSIDGFEIEDLEEGDYSAYEKELGVSDRMISGRRVEELRATIWVVTLKYDAINYETMAALNTKLKARRTHELFFLPSTGGTGVIYLVPKTTSGEENVYTEYIYINTSWEKIGDTAVDLSAYMKKTDAVAITNPEIDSACA